MFEVFLYLLLFVALGCAAFVGFLFVRGYLTGESATGALFGPKAEKRLDVVEQWNLDARRRLVLIRRDDVEHLIMTGGPVDVVIETGIGEKKTRAGLSAAPVESTPVFQRGGRSFGQANQVNGGEG
jgi:flagellar protein FliO/FliZ